MPSTMSRSSHVFSIFFVTVSLRTANAQFGEIAQVITGILGSGGGAGIGSALGGGGAAGLSGLSGLAGAGSAIGQGAAAGLGNIGSLYQLAQAALQLTGTGVGIANQASESAWFPVAVENVARMQREFQDRLLRPPSTIGPLAPPGTGGSGGGGAGGGGIFPALPGPPTSGAGTMGGLHGMIGTGTAVEVPIEYGKNFETENGSGETSSIAVRVTPNPESTQGPLTLLPQRPLPGLRSLLPGEASSGEETTDTLVPLPSPAPLIAPSSTPKVTIELPTEEGKTDYEDLINSRRIRPSGTSKELKPEKPEVEFSTDSEELLIPVSAPKAVAPQQFATKTQTSNAPGAANGTATTVSVSPQMVPALAKLITALRASNLTEEEFLEIAKQVLRKDKLEGNRNPGQPRENTSPAPKESEEHVVSEEAAEKTEKEEAADRNLAALRRALISADPAERTERRSSSKVWSTQKNPPVVISLPTHEIRSDKAIAPETTTVRPRVHAVTSFPRKIMPQKRAAQLTLTAEKDDETKIISVPAQQHVATRVSAETSKPPQRVDNDASVVMKELPTVEQSRHVPKVTGSTMTLSKNRSVGGGLVRSPTSHSGQSVQPKPFVAGVVQQVPVPPHVPQQQPLQTVLPMPGQAQQQQQQQYFYNYQQQPVQQWASAQYPQQYYYYNYASQAYQPAYYTAATQRPFPTRMVPEPQVTTPASVLRHPYSEGSLLTLPQPRFPGRRR